MKRLVAMMVFSVFLGTQILALNIGFKLSLYRIVFLTVLFGFFLMILVNDQKLRFYPCKMSSLYTMFYSFWLVYAFFSVVWAENLAGWAKANTFIGIGVFSIFFIQLFMKEKKDILLLFRSIAWGIGLHIVLGFKELLTGEYRWASDHFMTKYKPEQASVLNRIPISIYPNQNDYATIMLMGVFFLLILMWQSKNAFRKLFYLFLLLCSFFLIYQTDSRGNVFAFLIGIAAMVLVYLLPVLTKKAVLIFLGGGTAAAVSAFLMMPSLQEKAGEFLALFTGVNGYSGSSNETRVHLIKNGFLFLRDSLGFGVGAGNIEHWMKTYAYYPTDGISNMHNWWMEILTGYGLFIFLFYLLVYAGMLIKAYKYYRWSSDSFIKYTSLCLIGYLSAYVLSSISSASNIINEWQWVVFGVMIAFFSYCERTERQISYQENQLAGGHHG